jgi:hypothetical protein
MGKPITGGCLCGYIRYFCDGEVGPAGYCHCADCRRTSGSAFGISVRVEAASFHLTNGEVKGFTKAGESGRLVTRYFCPECGSPIYTAPPLHPDVYFLKAGSLDDPSLVEPNRQAWTRSRVDWATIDPDLISFETNRM